MIHVLVDRTVSTNSVAVETDWLLALKARTRRTGADIFRGEEFANGAISHGTAHKGRVDYSLRSDTWATTEIYST